ncbi:MAG: DUF2279 domain-containing protein [Oxalobacter sp.]|nr:MAG: DUF2279 domain-containing protein [Oxalobacter sp.]
MKFIFSTALLLAFLFGTAGAHAQEMPDKRLMQPYSSQVFLDDVSAIAWETATLFTATTSLGVAKWDWGSKDRFTSNSEGWFSSHTDYGGADKLGHAFTSYTITNVLTERLIMQGRAPEQAARTSALLSTGLQFYVEFMDGYSRKYGFSYEDMTMNLLGTGFAYARHAVPGMRDLLDFRMEYEPSGHKGFDPLGDYSGQKYLLAFKLSGTDTFRKTPLRYVELQTGYYTRGFSKTERAHGDERERHVFVGIGINLAEVFFGARKSSDSGYQRLGHGFFEHVQIPHTAIRSDSRY